MDLSGIYHQEKFYREKEIVRLDLKGLPGSNCYCDDGTGDIIRREIEDLPVDGIHFIDSGNYHYMTFFWLEKIKKPFRLLVFDNHTDMQPPAFGEILSCGGWIADSLKKLTCLEQVILAGPDEEAWSQLDGELAGRVSFLSREKLAVKTYEENLAFFRDIPTDLPLYISVDKDVLCAEDADTNWSQGDMRLTELLGYLECFRERFGRDDDHGGEIIGMDVCGECAIDSPEGSCRNDMANRELMELFLREKDVL